MKKNWMASLVVLLSCCFVAARKKGDGWEEYKYRNDGFAISAPCMPLPLPPSADSPNTRAYHLNYRNHTEVLISVGTLGMWEDVSDKEKLQRLKDLEVLGTSSKLLSAKEVRQITMLDPSWNQRLKWRDFDGCIRMKTNMLRGSPVAQR